MSRTLTRSLLVENIFFKTMFGIMFGLDQLKVQLTGREKSEYLWVFSSVLCATGSDRPVTKYSKDFPK